MTTRDAEVAVVGLGAWGSAALWRLAERGVDVVGIEQFGLGHALGSSHGESRMFRTVCAEHPGLVPLARRSRALWTELEAVSGCRLVEQTGGLLVGPRDGAIVAGTLTSAREHGIDVEVLDAAELRERYPLHASVPEHHAGVLEHAAGLVRPEETIHAAVRVARAHGARVWESTGVTGIETARDGAVVHTPARDLRVDQVVVTAGPWVAGLVPGLPAEAVRMPMTWFRPAGDPAAFALERLPVFMRELDDGRIVWGHGLHPGLGPPGEVKLGLEDGGSAFRVVDASTVDRSVSDADWRVLADVLPGAIPGVGAAPCRAAVCMVTRTPDRQFLLGRPRGDPRLVVGGGCSSHGFKHALGVGDVLADTVTGARPWTDLSFTDPDRFARTDEE